MTPCVKEPPRRQFAIRFTDGAEKVVRADKLTRPSSPMPWYSLERDGEVVAEYDAKGVSGWCMEEVDG